MSSTSNTHLDGRDDDIVLGKFQSYPQATSSDDCYYVSTANRHIFCDKSALKHTKRFPGQSGLRRRFCSNDPFAVGRGDVRVEDRYGDEETTILLCDVLHVPRARSNLISGVQLDKAGVIATLGGGHVTLSL